MNATTLIRRLALTALLGSLLFTIPAGAQVPDFREVITFQGVLRNTDGSVVGDGAHIVKFTTFNEETPGGSLTWWEQNTVSTVDGVFTVKLGETNPFIFMDFGESQWLEIEIMETGGGPMPRVEITPVPTALVAGEVKSRGVTSGQLALPAVTTGNLYDGSVTTQKLASDAAVTRLNNMSGRVTLAEGANVTITQVDTTLVIAAAGGAGGDDGDWTIDGSDLYRPTGRVFVGVDVPVGLATEVPSDRDAMNPEKVPTQSAMTVDGTNEGLYSRLLDIETVNNGFAAVYGHRSAGSTFHGAGYGRYDSKTGVTGYNSWGNNYTFGVAGYSWLDYPHSAGVLGATQDGSLWTALAYKDTTYQQWGLYTPQDIHVGGTTQTANLRVPTGAVAGHVLTADATGNATWQASAGGGGDDGDWLISGNDLIKATEGTVAIGTGTPVGHIQNETHLQIAADQNPSLSLDAVGGLDSRWMFANYAPMGQMWIGHDGGSGFDDVMILNTAKEVGVGTAPSARLHVKGGNADLNTTDGDFRIGNSGTALRVGTSSSLDVSEVNIRTMGTYADPTLNLGVDDHTVASIKDDTFDFYGADATVRARFWSGDAMNQGGQLSLMGLTSTATVEFDGHSGSGGLITVSGADGSQDANLAGGTSGGELTLRNEAGAQTVIIDGQYSDGFGRVITPVLEITGGADLSEQFEVSALRNQIPKPGMVVSIDPDRPGELAVCREAYDRRVAGVISGAGGVRPGMLMGQSGSVADGEHPVALTGRVYVYADAADGPIVPGDLLTTSDRPGHARRVDDHGRANGAILGKAMTALDEGQGLVLVLVSLQ